MVTSAYSIGSAPSELSMVSVTSARPSGARPEVPAKMTSSILPPRSDLAPCSPITQLSASTTLDFTDPFGPTTQVIPGSKFSVVAEAKDLKPLRVRLFRYTRSPCRSWCVAGSGDGPDAVLLVAGRRPHGRRWEGRFTLVGGTDRPRSTRRGSAGRAAVRRGLGGRRAERGLDRQRGIRRDR